MLMSGKRGAVVPTEKEKKKADDQVKTNYRAMINHDAFKSMERGIGRLPAVECFTAKRRQN
jgi:hypothetical protein